jgi:hypothetical protein
MHHLSGPLPTPANGFQFTMVGNAVDGGSVETKFKWGIAVHGSHYGSIKDNVVYNYNGAAISRPRTARRASTCSIATSPCAAWASRTTRSPSAHGDGHRGRRLLVPRAEQLRPQQRRRQLSELRRPRPAVWIRHQLRFLGNIAVPNSKGAMDASQFTTRNGNNMADPAVRNNEAYGAMQGGFTLWWVSSQDPQPSANAQESVIKDLKLWNIYNKTVYMYPGQKVTFDGLKIRGKLHARPAAAAGNGVFFADYRRRDHHPQCRHPGHGGRDHRAPRLALARNESPHRELPTCAIREPEASRPTDRSTAAGCRTSWWSRAIRGSRRRPGRSLNAIANGPRRRERAGMPQQAR